MDKTQQSKLAKLCRNFRIDNKYTLQDIADDLGVSIQAVSHFEHGRSSNMNFLTWYIKHGLDLGGFYG